MNAHHSIQPISSPDNGNGRHFIHDRLFLQTHVLGHKRLAAAYQRMQALLAEEQQEPTLGPEACPMIQRFGQRLTQLLGVFLDQEADPHLSCLLKNKAHAQCCIPGSPEFSKRLRFEYVNHIFLRLQHRALKKTLCIIDPNALDWALTEQGLALINDLQERLAEAESANEKILLAFEGYRNMLSGAQG
jgi:exonuclease VII small subunit